MSDREFRDLVKRMRANQFKWFRDRDQEALGEAKRLERLVDRELAAPERQGSLFATADRVE